MTPKVLIVDAQGPQAELLATSLQRDGLSVRIAQSATEVQPNDWQARLIIDCGETAIDRPSGLETSVHWVRGTLSKSKSKPPAESSHAAADLTLSLPIRYTELRPHLVTWQLIATAPTTPSPAAELSNPAPSPAAQTMVPIPIPIPIPIPSFGPPTDIPTTPSVAAEAPLSQTPASIATHSSTQETTTPQAPPNIAAQPPAPESTTAIQPATPETPPSIAAQPPALGNTAPPTTTPDVTPPPATLPTNQKITPPATTRPNSPETPPSIAAPTIASENTAATPPPISTAKPAAATTPETPPSIATPPTTLESAPIAAASGQPPTMASPPIAEITPPKKPEIKPLGPPPADPWEAIDAFCTRIQEKAQKGLDVLDLPAEASEEDMRARLDEWHHYLQIDAVRTQPMNAAQLDRFQDVEKSLRIARKLLPKENASKTPHTPPSQAPPKPSAALVDAPASRPKNPRLTRARASAEDSVAEGDKLFQAEQWDEASKAYLTAIARNPREPAYRVALGRCYARIQGDTLHAHKAKTCFTKALEMAPNDVDAHWAMAEWLASTPQAKQAIPLLERLLSLKAEHPKAAELLAMLHKQ